MKTLNFISSRENKKYNTIIKESKNKKNEVFLDKIPDVIKVILNPHNITFGQWSRFYQYDSKYALNTILNGLNGKKLCLKESKIFEVFSKDFDVKINIEDIVQKMFFEGKSLFQIAEQLEKTPFDIKTILLKYIPIDKKNTNKINYIRFPVLKIFEKELQKYGLFLEEWVNIYDINTENLSKTLIGNKKNDHIEKCIKLDLPYVVLPIKNKNELDIYIDRSLSRINKGNIININNKDFISLEEAIRLIKETYNIKKYMQ